MNVRGAKRKLDSKKLHARVIEQLIGGIVRIPRGKVGPYSVSKDGLESLERGQRGAYAFPGTGKRSCRKYETVDVVQVRMANDKTTTGEEGEKKFCHHARPSSRKGKRRGKPSLTE
jgi:hypothetical protein